VAARVAAARNHSGAALCELEHAEGSHQRRGARGNLEEVAKPDNAGLKLLRDAAETMRLSARGIIGSCAWRARLPISTRRSGSVGCISPKRCPIARSPRRVAGSVASYAANIMSSQFPVSGSNVLPLVQHTQPRSPGQAIRGSRHRRASGGVSPAVSGYSRFCEENQPLAHRT